MWSKTEHLKKVKTHKVSGVCLPNRWQGRELDRDRNRRSVSEENLRNLLGGVDLFGQVEEVKDFGRSDDPVLGNIRWTENNSKQLLIIWQQILNSFNLINKKGFASKLTGWKWSCLEQSQIKEIL